MKRIISLTSAVLLACSIFTTPISAKEPRSSADSLKAVVKLTTHSEAGAVAWCDAQIGQAIDYDGAYGAQCVDFIQAYYNYLGVSPVHGNGADYATNALPEGWTRTAGGDAVVGDILVYVAANGTVDDENYYPSYGHVGICGYDNHSYHQNLTSQTVIQVEGDYKHLLNSAYVYWGYIRPDFTSRAQMKPTAGQMYRLYNPNSGEHFYTGSASERDAVKAAGWNDEGVGWTAPSSGSPVYRLYNAAGGEHHYTMNNNEKNMLVNAGWDYEGIGWYSNDAQTVPVYREYNPNAFANNHNYTVNGNEASMLVKAGWNDEGIAWYGM